MWGKNLRFLEASQKFLRDVALAGEFRPTSPKINEIPATAPHLSSCLCHHSQKGIFPVEIVEQLKLFEGLRLVFVSFSLFFS